MGCESSTWTEYCTSGRPPVEFARDLGPAVGVGAAARHSRPVAPGSHQIAPVVSMETSGTTVHTARPFISTPLTVCITPRFRRGGRMPNAPAQALPTRPPSPATGSYASRCFGLLATQYDEPQHQHSSRA